MRWGRSMLIAVVSVVSEVLCANLNRFPPNQQESCHVWEAAANIVTVGQERRRAEMHV